MASETHNGKQPLTVTQSGPAAATTSDEAAGGPDDVKNNGQLEAPQQQQQQRSHSLTGTADREQLQCIAEDPDNPPAAASAKPSAAGGAATGASASASGRPPLTTAQQKRATMVKKAIRYFEDKSNRSVSEDNLFTRRKNLAAHLGLDEKVNERREMRCTKPTCKAFSSAIICRIVLGHEKSTFEVDPICNVPSYCSSNRWINSLCISPSSPTVSSSLLTLPRDVHALPDGFLCFSD